jgi:hypothetical protein
MNRNEHNRWRLAAFASALAFCAACSGRSTTTPAAFPFWELTGTVRSNGVAMSGVTLMILNGANQGQSTATNSGGVYRFPSLKEDTFNVRVTREGFLDITDAITLTSDVTRDFTLTKVPAAELKGSGDLHLDRLGDGSYRFTGAVTNVGNLCAASISGVIHLSTTAGVLIIDLPWTAPASMILRPNETSSYTGCCAPSDLPDGTYTTSFQFQSVSCT